MLYGEVEGGVWDEERGSPFGGVTLRGLNVDAVDRNLGIEGGMVWVGWVESL